MRLTKAPLAFFGVVFALAGAELTGCAIGPDYHVPQIPTPDAFIAAGAMAKAGADVDLSQWWQALGDPELNSLIERAIRANPDIEIALTRLQAATGTGGGNEGGA